MTKVTHLKLDNGTGLDVSKLTSGTIAELVIDLPKIGNDLHAVLIKGKYRGIVKE
jgi:hypothetical protein